MLPDASRVQVSGARNTLGGHESSAAWEQRLAHARERIEERERVGWIDGGRDYRGFECTGGEESLEYVGGEAAEK